MSYRVFDTKEKKWLERDRVFLSGFNNDLYTYGNGFFKKKKLELLSPERYVVHKCTDALDKNRNVIYEGDICEFELPDKGKHKCIVTYIPGRAAYIFFDDDAYEYYTYTDEVSKYISIIGNVFDGAIKDDGDEL